MKFDKHLLLIFAAIATFTSASMVISNAYMHGVMWADKTILSLFAVVFCLGAHLILAWSKYYRGWVKVAAWLIWGVCLAITAYNQLSFFTNISILAGEYKAKNSALSISNANQIESVKQAISRGSARSTTVVARALSKATDSRKLLSLNVELEEAKRIEKMQDLLITLQGNGFAVQKDESKDPTVALLESVTHSNASVITIVVGTTCALALELLAAFLWYVLRNTEQLSASDQHDFDELRSIEHAVDSGKIKLTVDSIREFLKCSQDKAVALRRRFPKRPLK